MKKIEILVNENNLTSNAVNSLSKILYYCLFYFLISLGAFIGLLYKNNLAPRLSYSIIILIGQVEFIIVLVSLSLASDMILHAAYTSYLEKSINQKIKENLIFWENLISDNFIRHSKGVVFQSNRILYIIYCLSFISISAFGFIDFNTVQLSIRIMLAVVQLIEGTIIFILVKKLMGEYKRVNQLITNTPFETQYHNV